MWDDTSHPCCLPSLQARRAAPAAALLAWTPPSCKCPEVAMWWQPLLPLMREPMWASPELGGTLLPSALLCIAPHGHWPRHQCCPRFRWLQRLGNDMRQDTTQLAPCVLRLQCCTGCHAPCKAGCDGQAMLDHTIDSTGSHGRQVHAAAAAAASAKEPNAPRLSRLHRDFTLSWRSRWRPWSSRACLCTL